MEIRTITCHDVYNHGAALQALALVTYLNNIGHNAQIIHYKPDYLNSYYNVWKVTNSRYNKPLLREFFLLAKLPHRLYELYYKVIRFAPYNQFRKNFLPLTKEYNSHRELLDNPPKADAYIAGSDQIWNTQMRNGKDGAFYLDFAPQESIKIAYAASFAVEQIEEKYRAFVSEKLKGLDYISLREKSSLPLLASLGREGVGVCDPVFLLSREEWEQWLAQNAKKEGFNPSGYKRDKTEGIGKYLLIYDTEGSKKVEDTAVSIARKLNLKIVSVSSYRHRCADIRLWRPSPYDFVKLIAEAEYVVSNSFHASAFAIIFNRNFCVVKRSEKINSRMKSLTDDYKIGNRLVDGFFDELLLPIDYAPINEAMQKEIAFSKEFLNRALSNSSL